jgi:hypothetical protein
VYGTWCVSACAAQCAVEPCTREQHCRSCRHAEAHLIRSRPLAMGSPLQNLWTCGLIPETSSTYWCGESSTDASAYNTPHVVVCASCCKTLCAMLCWVRIGYQEGRCTRRATALGSQVVASYQNIIGQVRTHLLGHQPTPWPPGWVSERAATPRYSVASRRGRACRSAE